MHLRSEPQELNQPQFEFKNIDSVFRDEIVALRKSSYERKYGARVDVSGLEWNRADQNSTHLGAFCNDKLISCLRLDYLDSAYELEQLLQFPATHYFCEVPCFTLARAATDENFKNYNLNMTLRKMAYESILREPRQARFVFGTTFASARRLEILKSWGYEILVHHEKWNGYLNSDNLPIALFKISLEQLRQSLLKMNFNSNGR